MLQKLQTIEENQIEHQNKLNQMKYFIDNNEFKMFVEEYSDNMKFCFNHFEMVFGDVKKISIVSIFGIFIGLMGLLLTIFYGQGFAFPKLNSP